MNRNTRLLACLAVIALLVAACGGSTADTTAAGGTDTTAAGGTDTTAAGGTDTTAAGGTDTTAAAGAEGDITIGVAWNNFNEPRWANADKPAIQAVLEEAGAAYIEADAGSSAEQQLTDVENLISQGADALILLAQDGTAILPAVQSALEQDIPVIAYDRLIEDPGVYYITFDNVEVGRMQARAIYELVPEGNYVFIKGNQADANADFLFGGQMEVLTEETGCEELVDPCAIVNVGESYTDNWLPEVAQANMEQFLTQNNNDVQAVVASNDGMAGGVVAALDAQGLAGEVPVSGQDGDPAALNRVALGTQSVSVWKNAFALGQTAAEVALQLVALNATDGAEMTDVTAPDDLGDSAPAAGVETQEFTTPGGVGVASITLTPLPITQENLNVPIDAGWITAEEVCQGVEAGSVAACP